MKSPKKSPKKKRDLTEELEEGMEELTRRRKPKSVPIDVKEWAKFFKKTSSLLPPKWIQEGITKEEWDKKNTPKKKRKKKNEPTD